MTITYTVQRHTDYDGVSPVQPGNPNLKPWTVLTEEPYDGWTSRMVCVPGFDTEEEARRAVAGLQFERMHIDPKIVRLNRAEYESRCAAAGVTPWDDERIWLAGYTLKYFDHPGICEDTSGRSRVETWLHQRRSYQLDAEYDARMHKLAMEEQADSLPLGAPIKAVLN